MTLCLLFALCSLACTKQQIGNGQVNFDLKSQTMLIDVTKSNVSDFTTLPQSADFIINVTGNEFSWSGKLSEWDTNQQLLAGNYSVTATYGALEEEGFDKPYFVGTKEFSVLGGQTQTVSIPVSLGNTVIKLSCSENFKKYFKDYSFKLSRDNQDIVTYEKDETRAAFIDGYKISISANLVGEMKTQTFSKEYSNLDAATAYNIAFDVNNVGGASITVTFNNVVETIELGDIELND